MAYQGADPVQLRTVAARFDNAADTLDQLVKTLNGKVNIGWLWTGADADRFRSQWAGRSSLSVKAAADGLRQAGIDLRRNAEEQERVSGAVGLATSSRSGAEAGVPTAPASTSSLFDRIKVSDRSQDGIYIEQVIGADGRTRFIVYLNGTSAAERLTVGRNAEVIQGRPDSYITGRIDAALAAAGYKPGKDGPDVMFVGFSQGGMDAQNIAAAGRYHVTDLVTYGAPLTHADQSGINTVHLRAKGDGVPQIPGRIATGAIPGPAGAVIGFVNTAVGGIGDRVPFTEPWAGPSSHIFEYDPKIKAPGPLDDGRIGWDDAFNAVGGNHANAKTYETVGRAFDTSTDPRWAAARDSIAKFQGEVVATVDPTQSTK
ncbi:WXG100 family type VII secretion target [Mycobacterium sp. 141]|uniref:WXG100 family type VII secretion target n=1 Tax=Mycobacterium sp. 141 TaxID=1120797 RepID=UPI000363DAB9|nr:WXG100 family type VII secretion target [Mycobacterium sp. 141]